MHRHAIHVVWVLLFFLHMTLAAEAGVPAYQPGQLLVQFRSETRAATLTPSERNLGVRSMRALGNGHMVQLALPDGMSVSDALAIYRNDPDVVFAEPNYLLAAQGVPSDPYFTRQWGLSNTGQSVSGSAGTAGADIDAVRAWDLITGDANVVVAVIDTGCHLTHPDLVDNLWVNTDEVPDNGLDDDHNGYVDDRLGWDFADNDNYPQDASGHGTHVAGIIAAQGNNAMGVSGIAWQARIMPLRFLNAFDSGTVADAIAAINYARGQGARIINCSWGSSGYSISLYTAMAVADTLFVCAAGNYGVNTDRDGFYPASYSLGNIISVAASDQADQLAYFSNYGPGSVHLAAPGSRIYSLGMGRENILSENFSVTPLTDWVTGGVPDSWGVRLAPDSLSNRALAVTMDDTYSHGARNWAISPALDLSTAAACKLTFQIVGATEAYRDYLFAEASTDALSWDNLPLEVGDTIKYGGLNGNYPYWTTVTADLGNWDHSPSFYIRFRFTSNNTTAYEGYYIDNVILSSVSDEEAYAYMSGTSMAAPFVSGVAALVLSYYPGMTPVSLKSVILDSADQLAALDGTSETDGRLNAMRALSLEGDATNTDLSDDSPKSGGGGGGGGGCFIQMLVGDSDQ